MKHNERFISNFLQAGHC